jgi:hypothetical protein
MHGQMPGVFGSGGPDGVSPGMQTSEQQLLDFHSSGLNLILFSFLHEIQVFRFPFSAIRYFLCYAIFFARIKSFYHDKHENLREPHNLRVWI